MSKRALLVLIVDDDRELRESLVELLEDSGFTTLSAGNGREAIDLLHERFIQRASLPDALLVDLMMPVMNGWELAKELAKEPLFKVLRVVVMSAFPELQTRYQVEFAALQSGRLPTFIRKPFDTDKLLDALTVPLD